MDEKETENMNHKLVYEKDGKIYEEKVILTRIAKSKYYPEGVKYIFTLRCDGELLMKYTNAGGMGHKLQEHEKYDSKVKIDKILERFKKQVKRRTK